MIKKSVTPEEVVELLNNAIATDQRAMNLLINQRVQANESMAKHPTIQVMKGPQGAAWSVGMLGILNGLFGVNEHNYGCIFADFDDETKRLKRFFVKYDGKNKEEK